MNSELANTNEYWTPVSWKKSIVKSFCEIPLKAGSKYISIEIQTAENSNTPGFLAILHCGPGVIDILFEKHLALDREWARSEPSTAHLSVRNLEAVHFHDTHCHVSASKVDVKARFTDTDGDEIKIEVEHTIPKQVKPIFIPTPPHSNPTCLRFMVMNVFCLLPRDSHIEVLVASKTQLIKYFLLPKIIAPYTGTRAGGNFILTSLSINHNSECFDYENQSSQNGIQVNNPHSWLRLNGFRTTAEIQDMTVGSKLRGEVQVISSVGQVATGQYRIERKPTEYYYTIENIKQDWHPAKTSITRQLMRLFRNRNRRHENWKCEVSFTIENHQFRIKDSKWSN